MLCVTFIAATEYLHFRIKYKTKVFASQIHDPHQSPDPKHGLRPAFDAQEHDIADSEYKQMTGSKIPADDDLLPGYLPLPEGDREYRIILYFLAENSVCPDQVIDPINSMGKVTMPHEENTDLFACEEAE